MIEGFTDGELFTKKRFTWTGTTSVGSYFVSSTSSDYDWAAKNSRAYARTFAKRLSQYDGVSGGASESRIL